LTPRGAATNTPLHILANADRRYRMKKAGLKTRLYLRLLAVILGIGLVFGITLNHYLGVLLVTEVADKANLVLSNVLAVQTYVRDTLRPTMYDTLPHDSFVIEAMSTSYITRKVMTDFNMTKDKFTYRRVALDPRNPEFGADARERELIAHFKKHPGQEEVSRYFKVNGDEYFIMARPVVFEESCLTCHGKPGDAPKVLLTRYGDTRGFGRHEGEIGGLDSIIMPVQREADAINRAILNFIVAFACGTVVIMGMSHFYFDRIMVANVGRLAALLRSRFPAEAGRTLDNPPRREQGEIEGMVEDMERFADHLREAKEQLRDYAANLETKVSERTAEATAEASARSADVRLFLYVLELFVKGSDRAALLDQALEAVARRFGAGRASFNCFYSMNAHVWPRGGEPIPLDVDDRTSLIDGVAIFRQSEAVVPVQASKSPRGALSLGWVAPVVLSSREREVLEAVGRQVGIALENLEVMENLFRQKTVLESIFEGIADPLFLLSSSGEVVHANESANLLLVSLGGVHGPLRFASLSEECARAPGATIQREVILPDGRSLTLRAYPIGAIGGPGRTIVYARDNTTEKTMLARLQQSEKSLAVGMLAAGLAHEINNPLGVILCYTRLLWDDGKSPHAADLDIIIRYTLQARKVLLDLMRFSRPKPETEGAASLGESVEFIARVFRGKASKSGVEIVTNIPEGLPPVRATDSALEQILTNLMLNAMDALEEQEVGAGGVIRVTAWFDPGQGQMGEGEVAVEVRDSGPGIPPENLNRLFDPFFTTKSVGKGTGLGLSVVYGLVRGLGGHIDVASDSGAVFTVRLPAAPETPAPPESKDAIDA